MFVAKKEKRKNTWGGGVYLPVRADMDDGDPRHGVTMHDGVEDGC